MSRQMAVIGTSFTLLAKGVSRTAPARSSTMNTPAMTAVSGTVHQASVGEGAEEAEWQQRRERRRRRR